MNIDILWEILHIYTLNVFLKTLQVDILRKTLDRITDVIVTLKEA